MRRYGLWCGLCCALVLMVGLLAVPAASALENYTQVDEWGASALGEFANLRDIAADPSGGLWVAAYSPACDPESGAVFELNGSDSLGTVIDLGGPGPVAVGGAPGHQVYVSDDWNPGQISIFDQDGSPHGTIYDRDCLNSVTGIAFDSSGDPYFANNYWENETRRRDYSDEATYERVWKFDGEIFVPFGDASDPSASGWVTPPFDVAVDTQGNVYISSYSDVGNTLKEFDSDGNYLATILRDGVGGDPTDYWAPVSLATDSNDNVYALDTYGDGDPAVVRKFDSAGNLLATIDTGTNMSAGLAVDADGNVYVGDDRNNVIRVFAPSEEEDTTAPTCEFSFDGTAGDNGWYTSAGDAVVSATDDEGGSGVASIHCAVDGIEQPAVDIVPPVGGPVSAGFSISTEGKHTVTYWAVDAAGNESEHQSADVWIDTIAPAGTFAINGGATTTHSTSITVDSAVTDANGVEMNFSVDGESWTGWLPYAASEPLTLPAGDGTKMVDAEYRDPAGNELDLSDTIVLDTTMPTDVTAPTVTIDSPQAGATYPSYPALQPLMLSFSANDEVGGSGTDLGLWHASVTWPDGHTTPVPLTLSQTAADAAGGPLPTSAQGDYTVTVTARDVAGNLTTATVTYSVAGGWSGLLGLPPDTNGDGYSEVDSYSTSHPLTLRFQLVTGQGGGLTKAQRCLLGKKLRHAKPRLYVWDVATHTLRFKAPTLFHRLRGNWYVYRWDTRKVKWDASWPLGRYRRMLLVIKLYDAKGSGSGTLRLLTPQVTRSVARAGKNKPTATATLINYRKMMTRES